MRPEALSIVKHQNTRDNMHLLKNIQEVDHEMHQNFRFSSEIFQQKQMTVHTFGTLQSENDNRQNKFENTKH